MLLPQADHLLRVPELKKHVFVKVSYLEVISEAIATAHYVKIAPYVHVVEQPRTRDLLLTDARAHFSIFNSSMVSHLVQDYLIDIWKYVLAQELCLVI